MIQPPLRDPLHRKLKILSRTLRDAVEVLKGILKRHPTACLAAAEEQAERSAQVRLHGQGLS